MNELTYAGRLSRMLAVTLVLGAAISTAGAQGGNDKMSMGKMNMGKVDMAHMTQMMADWPQASRDAIKFMTDKYGAPAAMTDEMAVWGKTGPWKRTVVYKMEYAHAFPGPHTDVMQQWIDYRVPPGKFNDLAWYDGSVVVERTSGEISARCDKEAANFLALNLTNDIVMGKRSINEARHMYGDQIMAMKAGKPAPYTERLQFTVSTAETADPDHPGPVKKGGKKR